MRKVLIAAVAAFAGMSTMAHAADIYEGSLKDEPVAYTPAPIWSGLYVGGHVGGLWNDGGDSKAFFKKKYWNDWKEIKKVKFEDDEDESSLLGGVHIGYNWQNDSRVFGIEGDISFAKSIDYLASLRARLGHVVDDMLIYGTAGVAFAKFDDKIINTKHHSYEFSGDNEIGLVVGGGVERKLTSDVTVGLEGLYYFFGDSNYSKEWEKYCKQFKITHEDDNDLFVVRARLSYSLQRDEPTLDSYK